MTTEVPKLTINEAHWAGRKDMKDYIHVSNDEIALVRHVPTGLELAYASADRFRMDGGSNYYPFDFGLNLIKPVWAETVIVYMEYNGPSGAAWKIMRERGDDDISAAKKILRQRVGCTHTVIEVRPFPPHAPIPWSPEIIQVLLNMVLIKLDSIDFRDSKPPKPDRAVFAPPTLPKHFHATLTNFVPDPKA